MKIPSLPEKQYTCLIVKIAVYQWFILGLPGMMTWLFTFQAMQPWHSIGGWTFCGSLATLIVMSVLSNIYDSYRTVSSGNVGYYWLLKDDGSIVPAKPGRYWFGDKDSLFVLYQTTRMGAQCRVGSWLHDYNWTLQFTGNITREAAVAFVNWYDALPFHRQEHDAMVQCLQHDAKRTDLPFQVVLPQPARAH